MFGKGSKERIVPIHPLVTDTLHDWRIPKRGPVFTRPRGGPWLSRVLSREVGMFFEGLGIDAHFHMCRHRFGTMTYEACKDIRVVQELMGHESPDTTARYAAYSKVEAKRAVLALPFQQELALPV